MYKDTNVPANRMSKLLSKIERRLGVVMLNLPEQIGKDYWPTIIEDDSMPVFSRFFPYAITVMIDHTCHKDNYFFIDKDVPSGSIILGAKDVDWQAYRNTSTGLNKYHTYEQNVMIDNVDGIALTQAAADYRSLFDLGIYVDFLPPNKIMLVTASGAIVNRFEPFPLKVFIQHPMNLMTISPTMMGIFEDLCTSDVAAFLYQQLKYFDDTETTYMTLNLRLETLQEWMNRHDDIVRQLDEAHVSTANENQYIMITT